MIKISTFDIVEHLDSEEMIVGYISAVIAENDPGLLLAAIGDVARARGITKVARDAGIGRESLYKSIAPDAKPRYETVVKLLSALGVKLVAVSAGSTG